MEQEVLSRCACQVEPTWETAYMSATSTPRHVSRLRREIMEFFAASSFTRPDLADLETAVGEACANAVKHGSPRGDHDEVRAKCMKNRQTLIVEISDDGSGFDPACVPCPSPEHVPEGGMGVFLMKALTDSVEFEFTHGTTVRLVKSLHPESY